MQAYESLINKTSNVRHLLPYQTFDNEIVKLGPRVPIYIIEVTLEIINIYVLQYVFTFDEILNLWMV